MNEKGPQLTFKEIHVIGALVVSAQDRERLQSLHGVGTEAYFHAAYAHIMDKLRKLPGAKGITVGDIRQALPKALETHDTVFQDKPQRKENANTQLEKIEQLFNAEFGQQADEHLLF